MISICSLELLAVILASASWAWIWIVFLIVLAALAASPTCMLERQLSGCSALSLLGDQPLQLLLELVAVEPDEDVSLLDDRAP